ncbi:MAG: heme-binding protein, partial [Pseudomonadota bacterium]
MRKAFRMLGFGLTALGFIAVAAIGVWVYVIQNVEQPPYTVVKTDGAIEVRNYPELVVAEVTRRGERRSAVSAGFSPLAGYIFAKDRAGDTISMTAPVTQQREKIAMTAPVLENPEGTEIAMTAPVLQNTTLGEPSEMA